MSVWNEYKWLKCFQHEHRIHQGMPLHVWMYMWATQIKCCNAPRGGPTVQSQHLPPGGQPLQKHCFRYNIYAHANAESHVDTQLQSISFWIDILLDARLNVADYPPTPSPLPPKMPSPHKLTSFCQTTQDNNPTGAISLTHQEALRLSPCLSLLCRVKEGTRSFTVTQMCKMSGMFKHVRVLRWRIFVQSISEI